MDKFIIGIGGHRGVGKDTVAKMINYILYTGITKANYDDYFKKSVLVQNKCANRIIHFGDKLKDCVSLIFNIDRGFFDNHEYKDDLWYNLKTKKFQQLGDWSWTIDIDDLRKEPLADIIGKLPNRTHPVIKLRTLLQYFGTDICRHYFGDNIWVDSAINKAKDIAFVHGWAIIPDVRFENESNAILDLTDYKTKIIKVTKKDIVPDNHKSENSTYEFTDQIDNDETKLLTFYKVLTFVKNLING
jgi:hypothetical protein